MRNNKGITLIALVITIIVLLILAGVSIAMLTGQNGILNQANRAGEATADAEAEERINLELNALYSEVLEKNLAVFDATETTGHEDKTEANLPEGYTAELSNENKTLTITGGGKSGYIQITAAGVATIHKAQ